MGKRKKHILSLEPDLDFDMIGICSHHNDYRLVWGINDKMSLKLSKSDDYCLTDKKGEIVSSHSMYEFVDELNRIEFYLVKNKSQGKYLVQEKPTIDYFLFLCDNIAINVDELMQELKTVPSILGVYQFHPEEVSSAENLVFN
jgi:hypothetical protein